MFFQRRRTAKRIRRALALRNYIRMALKNQEKVRANPDLTSGMRIHIGKRTGKIWIEPTATVSNDAILRTLKH